MGAIIGGAAQIAGSLIGGKKRRREQKAANAEYAQNKENLKNFEFQNYNKGIENVYEDATVNQQASNFQAQQTDAGLAQGLDAITAGGGGGGSAQAIANAALGAKQGISNDIAGQEQSNNANRLDAQAQLQAREADTETSNQASRFGQTQQQFGLAQSRKDNADQARADATNQLVGGIGKVAGGIASGGLNFGGDK